MEEVEWEIIGGEITKMPVEFWRRNLPFALEQCRDFNAQLKTPGSVNVLSNLIFSDQRRRADYIDLFNQYGDWPEMCVYTSWEPETNRFGKRDKLMPAWRETVSALKVRQRSSTSSSPRPRSNWGRTICWNSSCRWVSPTSASR